MDTFSYKPCVWHFTLNFWTQLDTQETHGCLLALESSAQSKYVLWRKNEKGGRGRKYTFYHYSHYLPLKHVIINTAIKAEIGILNEKTLDNTKWSINPN